MHAPRFLENFHRLEKPVLVLAGALFVFLAFATPASVSALGGSPATFNLLGQIPGPVASSLSPTCGCKYYNTTGVVGIGLDMANSITSASKAGLTRNDYLCVDEWNKAGKSGDEILQCLNENSSFVSPGIASAVGSTANAILQQRPASATVFAQQQLERFIDADTAYAQQAYFPGTGFALLSPIQAFWGWAVTVSYSLMIILISVVAFAMLFRQRLGGEQIVQIQNAIPNIVLAMILIPLSYPIAGLFIDGITLGTNIFHDFIFSPSGPAGELYRSGAELGSGNAKTGISDIRGLYADDPRLSSLRAYENIGVSGVSQALLADYCNPDEDQAVRECTVVVQGDIIQGLLQAVGSVLCTGQQENCNNTIIDQILNLLFNLAAIVVSLRITWRLLKSFLILIFLPMISPFMMATVAIPGTGTKMVRNFAGQMGYAALSFVVTYAMFILAIVFAHPGYTESLPPSVQAAGYRPPLLSPAFSGLLADSTAGTEQLRVVFLILGAGIFLAIPKVLDALKQQLAPASSVPFLGDLVKDIRKSGATGLASTLSGVRTIGRTGAASLRGAGRVADFFRAPGSATTAERARARGAGILASAGRRLETATGPSRIIAGAGMGLARGIASVTGAPSAEALAKGVTVSLKNKNDNTDASSLGLDQLDFKPGNEIPVEMALESDGFPGGEVGYVDSKGKTQSLKKGFVLERIMDQTGNTEIAQVVVADDPPKVSAGQKKVSLGLKVVITNARAGISHEMRKALKSEKFNIDIGGVQTSGEIKAFRKTD